MTSILRFFVLQVTIIYFCCTGWLKPALCADEGTVAKSSTPDSWHLLEPFWQGTVVHRESVLFVASAADQSATANLLRRPQRILQVAAANGSIVYEQGRDYEFDPTSGELRLLANSRIPSLIADQLYPPLNAPRSIAHRAGHPQQAILFDNEHWFHDQQTEITYQASEPWFGYRPSFPEESLTRTRDKLSKGEPLTIAVSGDSISFGLNASKLTGAPPYQPIYPELIAQQLEATFKSPIQLVNRAIGGWRLEQGLNDLDALLASNPDLIIVAYGMNHFGSRDPEGFRELQKTMLDRIAQQAPDADVILVAPMHGNTQWVHTPAEQFEPHRAVLQSFVNEKIALADLTSLWGDMLQRKRDCDLTGNGVNHPNDFGHRVYASAILSLLVPSMHDVDFPEPVNTEPSSALPMSPDEVVRTATLPEGFQLSVFAAEPDVQNPIAIAGDERGRLWVAENYTWAGNSLGNYRTDLSDRILVFADHDGDGRHDQRTVFWQGAKKLTSVEVGYGGVWAIALPHLLFIPDRDRDDVPDGPPVVVLDGFNEDSVSHTPANGLRWGPDGWLYGRHGILATSSIGPPGATPSQRIHINTGVWRYHPESGKVEEVMHGMTNSWGFDYNRAGEMFCINTVIGHLWHVIPGGHTERMFGMDPNPHAYQLLPQVADHVHWDTGEVWHQVRDGVSDSTMAAGGGHAHIGLMIYQGDNWPETYRDKLYTLNLHGKRINCDSLVRHGAGYVAHHQPDLVTFADPFFRGMDLLAGPDGGVWIADWSDTGECHDHDGVHRTSGRIYKLTYGTPQPTGPLDLAKCSDAELLDYQEHSNQWFARTARRVLRDRRALADQPLKDQIPARTSVSDQSPRVANAESPASLAAGLAAHAMGKSNPAAWLLATDEAIVAWGIRLTSETPPSPDVVQIYQRLAGSHSSGLVALHLAAALQRLPADQRWEIAALLAQRSEWAHDPFFPIMVWMGIEGVVLENPDEALKLLRNSQLPLVTGNIARRLAAELDEYPEAVEQLVQIALDAWRQRDALRTARIVEGMSAALLGWSQATPPANWSLLIQEIQQDLASASTPGLSLSQQAALQQAVDSLNVVFGEGQAMDRLLTIAKDTAADPASRNRAIEALAQGKTPGFDGTLFDFLGDRVVHRAALQGLVHFDTPETPQLALAQLWIYGPEARQDLIRLLSSRREYAWALLTALEQGQIQVAEVSAFTARQIASFEDKQLSEQLKQLWGDVRPAAADKKQQIASLREQLSPELLNQGDLRQGRMLFKKACANCHVLYGEGAKIGPDLTGANRQNLEYLLENIIDPSASVGNEFRTTVFSLDDGRVVSGVIVNQSARTMTIQTPDGLVTIDRLSIEQSTQTATSLMPEALLQTLTATEVRDLFAYLMSRNPVAAKE